MKKTSHRLRVEGYYRLSQDDSDANHPLDVRIASRIQTIHDLATRHRLTIDPEDIHIEIISGGNIDNRPLFSALLERCAAGLVSHLITPYQHRLSRGNKADEQLIEDTFIDGAVTLITLDGVTDFGDMNYDPLPYEIRALVARQQRRDYIKSAREARDKNIVNGQSTGGYAAYGYRWRRPLYNEEGTEISPGYYQVIPEEYVIVEEIFRRSRTESLNQITLDLNRRLVQTGTPVPPGRTRTEKRASNGWYAKTVRGIMLNPFYAGFPSGRVRILRNGNRVALPEAEWIRPSDPLVYRHPAPPAGWEHHHWRLITEAEQREIASSMTRRRVKGSPRTVSPYLCTGLVRCSKGIPMNGCDRAYRCYCNSLFPHPGTHVSSFKVESVAYQIVSEVIDAMPLTFLQSRPVPRGSKDQIRREYEAALRTWREATENSLDLMMERRRHVAQYGEELYQAACEKAKKLADEAEAKKEMLQAQLNMPEISEALPLLARVREVGLAYCWERWTSEEKRQVIAIIVKRFDMVELHQVGQHNREIKVTVHEWAEPFYTGGQVRELPKRNPSKK